MALLAATARAILRLLVTAVQWGVSRSWGTERRPPDKTLESLHEHLIRWRTRDARKRPRGRRPRAASSGRPAGLAEAQRHLKPTIWPGSDLTLVLPTSANAPMADSSRLTARSLLMLRDLHPGTRETPHSWVTGQEAAKLPFVTGWKWPNWVDGDILDRRSLPISQSANTVVPPRSGRWGALRSEVKEEGGRSPAGGHSRSRAPRRPDPAPTRWHTTPTEPPHTKDSFMPHGTLTILDPFTAARP